MHPDGIRAGCLWIVTHPLTAMFGIGYGVYTFAKMMIENWRESRRLVINRRRK